MDSVLVCLQANAKCVFAFLQKSLTSWWNECSEVQWTFANALILCIKVILVSDKRIKLNSTNYIIIWRGMHASLCFESSLRDSLAVVMLFCCMMAKRFLIYIFISILYVTGPLFLYMDQILWHCLFICSDIHWQLVYLLCDGVLCCFWFLAESHEQ